jgi:hypothetical protein
MDSRRRLEAERKNMLLLQLCTKKAAGQTSTYLQEGSLTIRVRVEGWGKFKRFTEEIDRLPNAIHHPHSVGTSASAEA